MEAYASAGGIKTIKNLLLEYPDSEFLKSLDGDKVDGLLLDSEYDIGNEIAKEIYAFTGTKLGQGWRRLRLC